MPELPSLEIFKRYFDSTSLNQEIENVIVTNPEILVDVNPDELKQSLVGKKFISSTRYGKYLFAHINKNLKLFLHFGMTGFLEYHPSSAGHTKHARVSILFKNGNVLDFEDPRKFGKIGIIHSESQFILEKKLGPDALNITQTTFKKLFKNRKGNIKSLLMNQNFLAGIGNLYADEILYQSNIHPLNTALQLDEKDLDELYEKMVMVLKKAIIFQDNPHEFPPEFLLSHRYPGGECPSGRKLKTLKIGGRTTYYCPEKQKLRN